jgi:DNA topoisomerase-1
MVVDLLAKKSDGPRELGVDPKSGKEVLVKAGPFGPYVQLGNGEDKGKPKRVSLLKGMDPESVSLAEGLQLLSLPRTLGEHPETGKPVQAGIGRYGPYVVHNRRYVSLREPDNVLDIDLERALQVFAEAPEKGARRQAKVLNDLGEHPDGGPIQVLDGRYGPYVKYGKINATIPKGTDPAEVTLEQAVEMIAAKAAGKKTKSTRKTKRKSTKKSTSAK